MALREKIEILKHEPFFGFPPEDFERGGREQFIYMVKAGLAPYHKVMDLGCGILRAGYWLIHFLNRGGYCGIEPHKGRLELGLHTVMEQDVINAKNPRFDTNPGFDTSVFGENFDFFLAYSIWTHASKPQIQVMLDSFVRDAKPDGTFLATYLPATSEHPDYTGVNWYGTSHESDVPGCIYHQSQWIEAECRFRGLAMRELGEDRTYRQSWLEIRRTGNG